MGICELICFVCGILLSASSGQQYGHHNMPDAGAGVNPRPHLPRIRTGIVATSLPTGSVGKPKRSGAIQPPVTKNPPPITRVQPTSLPRTSQLNPVSEFVPLPPLLSTNSPWAVSSLPSPSRPQSCTPNPCKHKGRCVYQRPARPQCKCRHLYLGDLCEVVVSPPKNISMTQLTPEAVQISWKAPPRAKEIAGFVVQYNEFGDDDVSFSQIIHPSVTQFTLRDLEPGKQYTICISIVFYNVTLNKEALLRDQCREITTKPLSLSERGISVPLMAAIITCVILFLFVVMVLALIIQRKCLKQKVMPMRVQCQGASVRINANRDEGVQLSRIANAAPPICEEYEAKVRPPLMHDVGAFRPIKPNMNPFRSPSPVHECTNKGNLNEPHYGNLFSENDSHVIMLTQQQTCVAHGSSAPPDVTETNSPGSSHMMQCGQGRRLQRIGGVPPGNIRALPVTISNHVMRSANARDMDASSEFDLHRKYFFPKFKDTSQY